MTKYVWIRFTREHGACTALRFDSWFDLYWQMTKEKNKNIFLPSGFWRKIFGAEISTTYSAAGEWKMPCALLLSVRQQCNINSLYFPLHSLCCFALSSVWWSSYQKDGCLLRRYGYVHSSTQMCCKWILMGSWACLSTNLRARACAMHWNDCPASAQICWNALLLYQSLFLSRGTANTN